MRSLGLLFVTAAASALLGADAAAAIPVPALNLPELTTNASLVAAGQVTAVREDGRTSIEARGQTVAARRMVATLRLFRVLKGPSDAPTVSFVFYIPDVSLGYVGVAAPQFGLFFLRAGPQQSYAVLDPYYPFIIAAPDAPAGEGDVLGRVIAEVAYVMNSPRASQGERVRAVGILEGVGSEAATAALRRALPVLDGPLRLRAAAALLKQGDISALNLAEEALLSPQPEAAGLSGELAYAIRDGVTDERAVPTLGRLLGASGVVVRRSAAAALRHIGTDAVIEPLSKALQDEDREVRYQAVLGLAIVTGRSEWAPSIDLYDKDEQRYLAYWREWAKTRL
ncbi:MAG: HEAT repeat domain-containing protein [Acidobacteria bacterium]|nr:HEAT repeat domain-containing protein [Acidobacteriota bacterium]